MNEFRPTAKNLEKTRRVEERAKTTLQNFIKSNYNAIRAIRSYNKIIDLMGYIDHKQLDELDQFIQAESKGSLRGVSGVLCEIGESGEEFAEGHEGVLFGRELGKNAKAIKGCYFSVLLQKQDFECVVLDHGGSREYFDKKNKDKRRQYVERFANRRRGSLIFIGSPEDFEKLPLGFTAFLTDTGEKLVIEEIVGHRIQ